jgi:NAD(P)-dependent dehydrogenase (short-subunit alcohol dehydrogenase family)
MVWILQSFLNEIAFGNRSAECGESMEKAEVLQKAYTPTDLSGKVVLITGGGRGLGEAVGQVLSESHATIVIADIQSELAEAAAAKIRNAGGQAVTQLLDVTNKDKAQEAIDHTLEQFGHLDVLINNAAVDYTVSVEELSFEKWNRVIQTNLTGPFIMSKLAFPIMRQQGNGHIVNIVSTAAKRTWANASAYHASKWGLLGLSHALHVEGRANHIKVTAIIAGGMRTPFLLDRFPDIDLNVLQDARNVAETIRFVLMQPAETVIPEVMVIPMRESSWP